MIWGLALVNVALATDTVLHSFTGVPGDGRLPFYNDLVIDSDGTMYGMTMRGGSGTYVYEFGNGTIFKVTTGGAVTLLHSFTGYNAYTQPIRWEGALWQPDPLLRRLPVRDDL
jgi:uncharacterized repeat protein (TIGR03803 family)